ncbi:CHAT domain-containing protein [Leptothoe sp. PORK10 BA2]|nr:CHAT domain-containing protein [Leptothoe sp. PORK10 BA2]MEA5462506.1 CHAT domain-containing protein [Leptothoe sp. PORK10 BA2]
MFNLKLSAEWVVLSACQTGRGEQIRGEGIIGLSRGFMYAGAERVAVSLWNVNDEATANLMTEFYRYLLEENQSPAAALRTAQLSMWENGQSPYYWAAFTLQGEWR